MTNTVKNKKQGTSTQILNSVVDIQIGYQFRGGIDFTPFGTIPIIQLRNFDADFNIGQSTILCVNHLPSIDKFALREGDVLYASKGERNFAYAISKDLIGAIPASYFFVLRPRTNTLLPMYLAWYINQSTARTFLRSQAKRGTYMPVIPKSAFEKLPIRIPPIEAQEAIVALDQLRRREKVLIQKLDVVKTKLITTICLNASSRRIFKE